MKKKIAGVMLALVVFVTGLLISTKAAVPLKLSEKYIEFYPSERYAVVISSSTKIDNNRVQIKSKDIRVKKEGCEQTDVDYTCLLSFSGFKAVSEKVEIKYGNQVLYVDVKVKPLDSLAQNMSLTNQYEIALAKLLTKHHVLSTDDIKNKRIRKDVEKQIRKLKDKYRNHKDKINVKKKDHYSTKESPDVGLVLLTKNASSLGIVYGHAGIHSKFGQDVIETRGVGTGGVKVYVDAVNKDWKTYKVKTGIWDVNDTTLAEREGAAAWAYKQKGKPYALIGPGDAFFFCTKLVWRAWESQNIEIGHFWFATDMMTKSPVLTLKELYHE